MGFKFTAPRANPPICWLCDKALHAGGRSYVIVEGNHPAHKFCAQRQRVEFKEPLPENLEIPIVTLETA